MTENEVATIIVDAAYQVHTRLGPGLLESVYETVLEYELKKRGLRVVRQAAVGIDYDELHVDDAYRIDLNVEELVLVELKSVETVMPVHQKQLLTYLRLSGKRLGLLVNFGAPLIKQGIQRIANGMPEN